MSANPDAPSNTSIDRDGLARFITERQLGDPAGLRVENISFGHSDRKSVV